MQQGEGEWKVAVKRRNQISTIIYPFNPLDAQGWKGTLAPVKLNWRDIRPITSHRYHLPPSVHTTFVAERFVVCTFVPRPIESDPGALKVPFFHNNDDYDEVIFYHAGNFFSRDNIKPGMITFHPAGFTHGPHPKAFAAGAKSERKETDEVAVMIDARDALDATPEAEVDRRSRLCRQLARGAMKLASLKQGRDGRLIVVSRDLVARDRGGWDCADVASGARHVGALGAALAAGLSRAERRRADRQLFVPAGRLRFAVAARLSVGGRLGLCHACRARAQGARGGDAGVVLDRSADVSGRLGQFHRARGRHPRRRRGVGHRHGRRGRRDHRRRADGRVAGAGAAADPALDAGQRRQLAQSDPEGIGEGVRLLSVEAGDGVFAGCGDAGRTWGSLARRQGSSAAAKCDSTGSVSARRMPAST